MAGLTRSDFVDMLEEMYFRTGRFNDLMYKDHPLLAILDRQKVSAGRRYMHMPIRYAYAAGRSATFSDAQGNAAAGEYEAFQVTYVSNYGVGTVAGDVIDDAGENIEMVADAVEVEMDGNLQALRDELSRQLYGNLGGARAQVHATTAPSTTTLTLANPEDTVHFFVNQELVASDDDGADSGDALRNSGASATVTGVDRIAGTLTSDANWTAQIAALVVGDYLFTEGDFALAMSGLDGWIPASAPGSTAFFGVDRSVDTLLGGLRSTQTGKPIEVAALNAASIVRRHRGGINLGVLNPKNWNDLQLSLEGSSVRSRAVTVRGSGEAGNFGFNALQMNTDAGEVSFISDPDCPVDVMWLLDQESWALGYSGSDLVRMLDADGLRVMREASNDGVEWRLKFRGNLATNAPGHNMRVAISS